LYLKLKSKINNIQLLSQMLEKIAIDKYEIKMINNEQVKIKQKFYCLREHSERTQKQRHSYKLKKELQVLKYIIFLSLHI